MKEATVTSNRPRTLVHGTFARRAKWIRPGSALRARLDDAGLQCRDIPLVREELPRSSLSCDG